MSKSLYDQIIEKIGHNYIENYRLLKAVSDQYDVKSLPEEQYKNLDRIYSACLQIDFFKKELNLDISEVDIRRYMLDEDYRGKFFDLNGLKESFDAAETGDVDIMMFLATAFKENYFSPALSKYASKWCEKAAEAGNVDAMLSIGSFYRWGDGGVLIDIEKALYWYGKAAEAGNEDAIEFMKQFGDGSSNNVLEMSAISGIGGFGTKWYKSRWMIEEWYKKAEEGDAEAQYELGRRLMPGTDYGAFKRNTKESIKYYEMAAEQGVVDAMFNLANTYQYGWSDLEPDAEKEFYWRKKAADAEDAEAAYMVGKMYIEGNGTYEDFDEGLSYLKMAADNRRDDKQVQDYYQSVSRIDNIFRENKEKLLPIYAEDSDNKDFYMDFEEDDKQHLQEYLNLVMYDMICAMEADDGEYALSAYNHVITLIEFAVRTSRPVVQMTYKEHTDGELEHLVKRFLYHYLDRIEGDEGFYERLGKCAGVDEKKYRQACHKAFWRNIDHSIASVQKDFPDFMEGWIMGL